MTALLLAVGLNHKTAPVEVRERVAVSGRRLGEVLRDLGARHALEEIVVLSTCNRTEIYAVPGRATGPVPAPAALVASLAGETGPDEPLGRLGPLDKHLYSFQDIEAAGHLFRVAAGLDSLVLGESEILGQVKTAYEAACRAGSAGKASHALFQGALRAGSRARAETAIGGWAVSVPYVSLGLARKVFADLGGKKALIVGLGEIGRVALRHLAEAGLGEIVAANRTVERARAALENLGLEPARCRTATLEEIGTALGTVDIALVCTDAPDYVIGPDLLASVAPARRGRPLLLIDLGVPRQVDPAVARQPGIYLFNLDHLENVVQANLAERQREATRVERIVAEELARFDGWWRRRRAAPVIRSFRERAESIRMEELGRVLGALETASDHDREVLAAFSRRLTNRLLDYPTVTLRELAVQPDGTPVAEFLGRVQRGELVPRRDTRPGDGEGRP